MDRQFRCLPCGNVSKVLRPFAWADADETPPRPLPGEGTSFSAVTDSDGVEHLYDWSQQRQLVQAWRLVTRRGLHDRWRWELDDDLSARTGPPLGRQYTPLDLDNPGRLGLYEVAVKGRTINDVEP